MSDDAIHVVVEGENDDDGGSSSSRRIEELNRQADRDAAYAARTRLQTAHLRRQADLQKVGNDLLTLDSEAKAAEAAYRDAREYGDIEREVVATKRMSAVESRRNSLEMQEQALQRMPISSGDPVEDRLASFSDRTAFWLRQHPEYLTDPRQNAKAQGAHHLALSEGLTPDTDAYFEHCERTLGLRRGGNSNGRGGNAGGATRMSSDNGNAVRLSKGEVERANDGSIQWGRHDLAAGRIKDASMIGKPIGNIEYGRRKLAMQAQGYYRSE